MSFNETILFIAVCDGCNREADYDDRDYGWESKDEAVKCAFGDWAEVDGKLLCPRCRPCERCGQPGSSHWGGAIERRPGFTAFLCETCRKRPCATCGHPYYCHQWQERSNGTVAYRCTISSDFCDCPVFAEPEPVSTQPETETTK